ncbi:MULTISPECIES: Uma2 family endonuclease [Methylobacterium]|jgi:Uma2 family endonuclease|uniref:Uma2 family endonuclease n=1 Tax=Methylobacterium TaxID=407 RepID=UPI0008EC1E61|nr:MULTISPECIES: Uma2 family endonuclease [Methylobacterium]MBZ6412136.1 Uma2 family endonuclease [Methylobacterium sp.]MBK3395783.1 Uma2 family endonuclease [Methylobacterium ajmalii]MBK3410274.1 Uma2 family endonuclease [Methylobacterium ajmalii]MBK3421079.1 Uma2 family endonuclease [Methylobacterium ajmalii]SFF10965.1 Endonuclease, Uma2 family (restriction endonuclease fold) [Methylobacterium sp. yr596]
MSLALRRAPRMRVADFIAMIRERPDEERWELLDGEAVLMAPPSERHQQIVSNLLAALRPLVAKFGCRALPGLGLRNDFVDDYAPIPDVVVRCGPLLTDGYARDPLIVAEVLSPSTLNNDRGRKAAFYQALQTLRAYLIVYADEARVELWSRGNGPDATLRVLGRDDAIPLPDLGGEIPVAALYDGIPL